MLTEGEAALHYCVANLLNADITATDLDAARGVVIVDAGGGTIDLSMFLMKSNPISCEENAPAECMELSTMAEILLIHLHLLFRSTSRFGLCYPSG